MIPGWETKILQVVRCSQKKKKKKLKWYIYMAACHTVTHRDIPTLRTQIYSIVNTHAMIQIHIIRVTEEHTNTHMVTFT